MELWNTDHLSSLARSAAALNEGGINRSNKNEDYGPPCACKPSKFRISPRILLTTGRGGFRRESRPRLVTRKTSLSLRMRTAKASAVRAGHDRLVRLLLVNRSST